MVVSVDDFLILSPPGAMREGRIKEVREVWSIKQEVVLTETTDITFLGLQMKKYSGGVIVHQE
eukprot:9990088-Prorocentrum_lima.AAC.1